jgi:hypothetical protein
MNRTFKHMLKTDRHDIWNEYQKTQDSFIHYNTQLIEMR